ncbi:DUF2158 domain-containing protein [Pseudomonas yamanorum]|uniref:DUF2158 domain-containing protein n=1 Tax=Pseudomonas yamanorum TaxID=515393 RepID=A0A7Y8FAL7_9PSED|nr:DUF2158 domain-containing protein [Pseudomonas yamanorum]NWE75126.1 DUF2158 domain-containing protein [Pseudomonas yamanorum]
MSQFNVGDVVQSVLGDGTMTISNAGPITVGGAVVGLKSIPGTSRSDLVECMWFKGKECQTKRYNISELKLIKPASIHSISEGEIVKLASGGPKMLVEKSGPMEVGVAAMVSMTHGVRRVGGSVRSDLALCRWEKRPKDEHKRFPIATLIPFE